MVERKTPRKFHLENGIHILIGDLHRRKIEFKFVEQCQQMLHTAYFVQLKFGLPFIQVAKLATFMITFHFNLPENHIPRTFQTSHVWLWVRFNFKWNLICLQNFTCFRSTARNSTTKLSELRTRVLMCALNLMKWKIEHCCKTLRHNLYLGSFFVTVKQCTKLLFLGDKLRLLF